MVDLMLRDAAKKIIEIVIVLRLSGNPLGEARVREVTHRAHQFPMRRLERFESRLPCRFTKIRHNRKTLLVGEFYCDAPSSTNRHVIPHANVQDKFPNAMSVLNRTR